MKRLAVTLTGRIVQDGAQACHALFAGVRWRQTFAIRQRLDWIMRLRRD
jgi:hypothetical protein